MNDKMLPKILIALGLFTFMQMFLYWGRLAEMGDDKMTLEAEVAMLTRKRDQLHLSINELQREQHRLQLKTDKLDLQIRDLLPLTKNRLNLPIIFFVTPTKRRPTQKADLIRLHQTLSYVPNLHWVLVEDAETPSPVIDEILARTRLKSVHLVAATPPGKRPPRQRSKLETSKRTNFGTLKKGVIYFGDDDNVYDWKLFENIRSIDRAGVWPVGLVGGLLVETPILSENGNVVDFNAAPFPIDMAAFAVNITLVNKNSNAEFSYNVSRGYQESHFLTGLGLKRSDLEPKAEYCKQVYVWHTRTEKAILHGLEKQKFKTSNFTELERNVVA
ncbi:Galactosylgalactosylxylosylprotein 3-beta-glucuronosyltransferase [Aphelenchoides bicaudatus]|nr:Galactosylgalactosylxylosylprotein 3-beta-glucuronosyltransferase [Aphelenchoides bicaudatus]